jgi:hypothetical protein
LAFGENEDQHRLVSPRSLGPHAILQNSAVANKATHSSRRVEGQIAGSGWIVAYPDIDIFEVTSGLPVTRPEHGQLGFHRLDCSMSALAI